MGGGARSRGADLLPPASYGGLGKCARTGRGSPAAASQQKGDGALQLHEGQRGGYPRPTNGMFAAITVMNSTFASGGRLAM